MERVIEDIVSISGQRPIVSNKKVNFELFFREGDKIGCYVTMRGERAWDFLDRFVNLSLPRVKDFRGVSKKSFDSSAIIH